MSLERIKKKLKKAYNALPEGYKKIASEIHGCESQYFNRIVQGKVVAPEAYTKALESVKKASERAVKEAQESAKKIEVISEDVK